MSFTQIELDNAIQNHLENYLQTKSVRACLKARPTSSLKLGSVPALDNTQL